MSGDEVEVKVNDEVVKNTGEDMAESGGRLYKLYYKFEKSLKNPKTYFIVGLSLFIISALIGLIYAEYQIAHSPAEYTKNIETIAKQVTQKINWSSQLTVMIGIFKNNLTVGIFLFTITLISSGFIGFLFYIFNGGILGYVLGRSLSLHSLMLILPHGVVEIPAIVYFGWIGTRYNLVDSLLIEGKDIHDVKGEFISMVKHLLIASFLLLVSAFIEAFITGKIAGLFS